MLLNAFPYIYIGTFLLSWQLEEKGKCSIVKILNEGLNYIIMVIKNFIPSQLEQYSYAM